MDFDTIVKAALKSGSKAEDIARQFTDALNKTTKELEAKEKNSARTKFLMDIQKYVNSASSAENSLDLAKAIIFLYTLKQVDPKDEMPVEELEEYKDFIDELVKSVPTIWDLVGFFSSSLDSLSDLWKII